MNEYIYCFLVSAARDIDRNAPGTTFKEISGKAMAQIAMPLPPLPEQKRIVAKVDELMARCDELEAKQQVRRTKLFALNRASLRALTEPDRASLAPAWRRVREHFDHLYATPETVTELRQTILQLAVMGRLVPQDPNDEPALELLKRIQAEKRGQTVRNSTTGAGRTRGSRATPPVVPDRVPHALPGNWAWCRAEELLLSISDGDHQPPPRSSTGIPFLVIGNVSSGKLDFSGVRHVPMEYYRRLDQIRVPRQGDVLYTVTGSYGIAVVVDTQKEFCVQRHMAILKCPKDVLPRLVALWLSSPGALDQAVAGATGIAQQTVSLGVLRALLLPIPPLAEQKRIVARVDELLGLCDDLEIRLQQTQVRSDELLAAVMREIVGGVGPE
jgi:type I restriction enzyme S subunit